MQYIIAIDVGIKNLGMCVYDKTLAKVVYWNSTALVEAGRYSPMRNVEYVFAFMNKHAEYFQNASALVIERQMRVNMRIIEAVFQALCFPICTVLSPRLVKMHYDLSRNNYRLNKQAAVTWMRTYTSEHTDFFDAELAKAAEVHTKQDDLADALLMLVYYLETYS
jgi:hypothetical protein